MSFLRSLAPRLAPSLRRPYTPSLSLLTPTRSHSTKNPPSNSIADLLTANKSWASRTASSKPNLLPTLAQGQSPHTLWIGCADSRVPETTLLDAEPGEIFVHRNIANVVTSTDLSSVALIEFAVNALKVSRIVLCGHSACGGVSAALGNAKVGKIDTWLMPLRALRVKYAKELAGLDEGERKARVVELNVKEGVDVLRSNPDVIQAGKERGLKVFGVVYDLASGELKEVDCSEGEDVCAARDAAYLTS